jgi:hypothetical protein
MKMTAQRNGTGIRQLTLLAIVSVAALACTAASWVWGGEEDYYPYEPVFVSTDTAIEEIGEYFSLTCTIETPGGKVWTNCLTKANLVGRYVAPLGTETSTLFLANFDVEQFTNVFGEVGEYTIGLPSSTNAVHVVAPTNGEEELVGVVQGDMLPRIALLSLGNEFDDGTRVKCEAILQANDNGRYAEYARAYLEVERFYQTINPSPETIGQFRPDLSSVHTNLVALNVSRPILRHMVLFHLGYAEGLADVSNATNTLRSLLADLPVSPWSGRASRMLTELSD